MLHVTMEDAALVRAAFAFVRHTAERNNPSPIAAEQTERHRRRHLSTRFSTALKVEDGELVVWPQQ